MVRDFDRLINKFGWYKGEYFRNWVADIVERKTGNPNATFKNVVKSSQESGFLDMYFMGTNISTGFAEVFSAEHTPRTCIADAIRISMSIPLFFAAKRSLRGDLYVDGGLINNYPIKLFDREKYIEAHSREPDYYRKHNERLKEMGKDISPYRYNKETLGFRLDSAKEIGVFRDQAEPQKREIDDFFSYGWSLIQTIVGIQSSQHLHSDDWQRTIYIDTLAVGFTDFDITEDKKEALVKSGREHTRSYFKWYDDPSSSPANRP